MRSKSGRRRRRASEECVLRAVSWFLNDAGPVHDRMLQYGSSVGVSVYS